MSKTPNFDAKIKALLDATKPGERVCPITNEVWILTQEEIDRYRSWNVPPCELAPFTRIRQLASWGASVDLWWKPHFQTGKPILSGIHPDALSPVITDAQWFEKDWGAEHPLMFDASQSFFAQAKGLFARVPYPALSTHGSENCIGCGMVDCIDCYMTFGTKSGRETWYTSRASYCERVMDTFLLLRCENVFSSAKSVECNTCTQVFECLRCLRSAFLFDCQNCEDCFCSTNLRRKQYVFMNEQLSKAEYEKRLAEIDLSSTQQFEQWKKTFRDLQRDQAVWPENFSVNAVDCVGEGMMDCLNCSGFLMSNARDVINSWSVFDSEHVDTVATSYNANDCYYVMGPISSHNVTFSFIADQCQDCEYVVNCFACENCFGCMGLNRKKFCILNKQYTEEEYWLKLDEVKCAMLDNGEYGQFFPAGFAPLSFRYGYASLVAPFTEEELQKQHVLDLDPVAGMRYAPYDANAQTVSVDQVADRIADVGDDWIGKQFFDVEANRRYSVNKLELAYRKAHGYPFPRRHYTARIKELAASTNGPIVETTHCAKCAVEIVTAKCPLFSKRTVYCKACYYRYLESK